MEKLEELKKKLPDFKIFVINGNHDYYLSSNWEFPPDSHWMLSFLADEWRPWLERSALQSYRENGYYTTLLEEGIRIIAMNWGPVDVYSIYVGEYQSNYTMMSWFENTLAEAKKNNEHVLVLSHECIGLKEKGTNDLNPQFNIDYLNIIKKYQDIFISHFCGHSHYDSFRIMPCIETPQYHTLMFPAMTCWKDLDMKFSLVEYNNKEILNREVYMLNITYCTANGKYDWKKLYNSKAYYGLEKLTTETLTDFYHKLETDDKLWAKFMDYYSTPSHRTCKDSCKKKMLCSLGHSKENEFVDCINK